ncbi:hypothetical protein IMCC13023_09550 [Candidatus Aquiluna sp. IMCC13023]|nr:hypothetical protein IMCC13023_09550 [Candidatus Aquiluna sp. IMCC13023]
MLSSLSERLGVNYALGINNMQTRLAARPNPFTKLTEANKPTTDPKCNTS